MKLYICNALAMGMLDREVQDRPLSDGGPRCPRPITREQAREYCLKAWPEVIPAVGHSDTAWIIAGLMDLPIEKVHARTTVRLQGGPQDPWDRLELALIGAYTGPRLPERCIVLPEGAAIEWWLV